MSDRIIRNKAGFTSKSANHPAANFDFTDDSKWAVFKDHFLAYDKTQLIGGNPYTLTQTNGVDTIVGPTGVLTLTLGGADNDSAGLYLIEAPFQMSGIKRTYFECRFKFTHASGTIAANEIFIGLSSLQAPFASDGSSLAGDDMLGFYKLDGDANMSVTQRENDEGSTDGNVLTLTTGDWFTVAIYYDGKQATFWASAANSKDMGLVATLSATDVTSVVSPHVFVKAGEAKANILSVDYTKTAQEI